MKNRDQNSSSRRRESVSIPETAAMSQGLPTPSKRQLRSDPFNAGVDFEGIDWMQMQIDKLKDDFVIPAQVDYDIQNPIQLLASRVVDFTDRSAVLAAKKYGFDSDGFKQGRPLQKSMFYMDPYITCSWCNDMGFVDVEAVHRKMTLPPTVGDTLPSESLPPCRSCGKADHFVVGAHDFSVIIANREAVARAKAQRDSAAARVIMRAYRAYLRRAYGSAANKVRLVRKRLENKAATIINKTARGRLARRIYRTNKYLKEIARAHPVLIAYSLKAINGRKALFWYSKQLEIDLLFRDYVELCERKGFDPPRMMVEWNIAELLRRIKEREAQLLLTIQRHWRGVQARRIVKYFRTEVVRMRQFMISRILMIQRSFRAHAARLTIPKLISTRRRDKVMKKYQANAAIELRKAKVKRVKEHLVLAYQKEREEEKSARFTGRVDLASDHNDRKMAAFASSCYSDDKVANAVTELLSISVQEEMDLRRDANRQDTRRHFINARVEESGPSGFGTRGVKPDEASVVIVNGFRVGDAPASSRSKGMRHLFEEERKELMTNLIERVTKDFAPHTPLLPRFREYNTARRMLDTSTGTEPIVDLASTIPTSNTNTSPSLIRSRSTVGGSLSIAPGSPTNINKRDTGSPKHKGRRHKILKMGGDASAANLFRPREYKYPANINDRPMDWLNEDLDVTLKHLVKFCLDKDSNRD